MGVVTGGEKWFGAVLSCNAREVSDREREALFRREEEASPRGEWTVRTGHVDEARTGCYIPVN